MCSSSSWILKSKNKRSKKKDKKIVMSVHSFLHYTNLFNKNVETGIDDILQTC